MNELWENYGKSWAIETLNQSVAFANTSALIIVSLKYSYVDGLNDSLAETASGTGTAG